MHLCFQEKGTWCTTVLGGGGGGGDMSLFENSPRKWPNSHSKKYSKRLVSPPPPPPLFSGEGTCSSVFKRIENVLYCFQDMGHGALLFSGERNWCTAVLRRRKHVLYCFKGKITCTLLISEKGTGALLFQEKGSGALLFSGEGNWRTTD